jgi:hypothetical protein
MHLGRSTGIVSVVTVLLGAFVAFAGANQCDPGESPDVIVGAIFDRAVYGTSAGATGFAIGTESCNIGTCHLDWLSGTPFHPVIGQNMFRLMDGRFQQIGVGWLKHGFATLNNDLCGDCVHDDGSHLGVNCSDPYWATLNGNQNSLGPRFEVNATAGTHLHPYTFQGQTSSDPNYKRISVLITDLDPDLNPGAEYFVEGQYVTKDDADAGNNFNNSSYRRIVPNSSGTDFSLTGPTFQTDPALWAWKEFGDGTVEWLNQHILGGYEVIELPDGFYRYEYAIQNVTSDRSIMSFKVLIPHGATLRNIGFADADYHSGEPYDKTDWAVTREEGASVTNFLIWSTDSFSANEDANALRWGTVYNFWFESNVGPGGGGLVSGSKRNGELTFFKPGGPPSMGWYAQSPQRCGDSFCDLDETEFTCAGDCAPLPPSGEVPDGDEVPGSQLTVSLEENGDVTLNWGESCVLGDSDYGIYEGFIGDFESHASRVCTTGGQETMSLTPAAGGTYYLVVPNNTLSEGSYGQDSAGNPRAAGQTICMQQAVASCE